MIKCCSKKNKIWTVPLECLKSRSKLLKFTPNRVNKALFPLNAIEKFRFGSTLAAVKLMILWLTLENRISDLGLRIAGRGAADAARLYMGILHRRGKSFPAIRFSHISIKPVYAGQVPVRGAHYI